MVKVLTQTFDSQSLPVVINKQTTVNRSFPGRQSLTSNPGERNDAVVFMMIAVAKGTENNTATLLQTFTLFI